MDLMDTKVEVKLSTSEYCDWNERPLSKHNQEESRLEVGIKAAHQWTPQNAWLGK
jgi:hypothetical protein